MMNVLPSPVLDLTAGIGAFSKVLQEIDEEWRPEAAPLTTSMGDLGRAFAELVLDLSLAEVMTIFERVEAMLRDGAEQEKNAVATGFLEALAAALDRLPERSWILQHAGEETRRYLAEWDRFCNATAGQRRDDPDAPK